MPRIPKTIRLTPIFIFLAVVLYAAMPAWRWVVSGGAPQPARYEIAPEDFAQKAEAMIDAYATGEEHDGTPIVAPPPGDIYLIAHQFGFRPVYKLQPNTEYTLHVASVDILHGLNFPLASADTLLAPGWALTLPLTPTEVGKFAMLCSENCGLGHNSMKGWVIVGSGESAP